MNEKIIESYKDLIVWQKSVALSIFIYRLTSKFPKEELYGLVSQIRRAVVSIASNIAEGYERGRKLEYIRFLLIALASAAELETQLIIAKELGFVSREQFSEIPPRLNEIQKMLKVLIRKVREWRSY